MTTQRWSPRVEPFEYLWGAGFYILTMFFVAIASGILDNTILGVIAIVVHLTLTLTLTVICFGLFRRQLLGQCTVSEGFPPQDETKAVLEGRIIEAGDGVISPYSRTPCVVWGMVEPSPRQGRNPLDTVWHARPFLFEDKRGRGRILIEPRDLRGKATFKNDVPDLIDATFVDPDFCPADKKEEIALGLAEARGESSPRSWPCPSYEIVMRDGDDVLLRGRFVERERGSGIPGVPAYELRSGNIELGVREAIVTRHGSHWYGMWDHALIAGSLIATLAVIAVGIALR